MDQQFSSKRTFRKIAAWLSGLLAAAAALLAWMYWEAISDPVVRKTRVSIVGLSEPLRLVLLSDIHVGGPDMPPARLRHIIDQVNASAPDLILIAGDFVSDKRSGTRIYSVSDAIAPLTGLRSRLGTISVLGNHDHWRDASAIRAKLRRTGITVLDNDATRAGPLTIGGVDDPYTGNDQLARTLARMHSDGRPFVLLSHSPDIFPQVPPDVSLTLAGHTHCGQIRLPVIGAMSTMSNYGERYACGRIDGNGKTLIVTAGLGTSILPLRLGAPPDFWVIELRPKGSGNQ